MSNFKILNIDQIFPSSDNFRTIIEPVELSQLEESIRVNGIIEPLVVIEANSNEYFIICGERRWRAAKNIGLTEVPCIVKSADTTQEQIECLRTDENLHRKDLNPMDEARMFLHYKNKNKTIEEICALTHKSKDFISARLKLNSLIPELQTDIEKSVLPVSMGYVLCAYDEETQKKAISDIYKTDWIQTGQDEDEGHFQTNKDKIVISTERLRNQIEDKNATDFSKALFDKEQPLLRFDEKLMSCSNCEFRTGANAGLFGNQEEDYCLKKSCFANRNLQWIEKTQEDYQAKHNKTLYIVAKSWNRQNESEQWLFYGDYRQIYEGTECEVMVDVVKESDGSFGKVCLKSSDCAKHFYKDVSADNIQTPEQIQQAKAARKEELWNCAVAEISRRRILTESAKVFAEVSTDKVGYSHPFFARLWQQVGYNERKHVNSFLTLLGMSLPNDTPKDHEEALTEMSKTDQLRFGFILAHWWKGDCSYKQFQSQHQIVELAQEFGVNHELIDAQVRLELSSKKFTKIHQAYLQQVEVNDPQRKVPLLYTEPIEEPKKKEKTRKAKKVEVQNDNIENLQKTDEKVEVQNEAETEEQRDLFANTSETEPETVEIDELEAVGDVFETEQVAEVSDETENATEGKQTENGVDYVVSQARLAQIAESIQSENIQNKGKITQVHEYLDNLIVCTGRTSSAFGWTRVVAYSLTPIEEFTEKIYQSYKENPFDGYRQTKVLFSGNNPELNGREFVLTKRFNLSDLIACNELALANQKPQKTTEPQELPTEPEHLTIDEFIEKQAVVTEDTFACAFCGQDTLPSDSPDLIVCNACDTNSEPTDEIADLFNN